MNEKPITLNKYLIIPGVLVYTALYFISLYSFILFHTLIELSSIAVAFGIFMLLWNSRRYFENHYLQLIGIAYLFVGLIDLLHTLAYKGISVFQGYDADLPTQLWIAGRYIQSVSLLVAPFFIRRKLNYVSVFFIYSAVSGLLLIAIFSGLFPACYIEGVGLTTFKKVSEYVISVILLGSIVFLFNNRNYLDKSVFSLLLWSISLTIVSELLFTFYISVYGFSNLMGHYLKLFAYYLIYRAIVVTGLMRPYDLLFRDLKRSEKELRESDERYRKLFNGMHDGFALHKIVVDDNGRALDYVFLDVNDAFERLTGLKRADIIGKKVTDVIPEIRESGFDWIGEYGKVALTGEVLRTEQFFEPFNKWFFITAYSTEISYFVVVFEDVSERKQLEKEKEHLASFPQLNPNPIIEVSSAGNIIFHNNAAIETLRTIAIKEDVSLFLPDDISEILKELEQKSRARVYRVKKINENYFGEDIYLSPEFNSARIYVNDITQRKRAEDALKIAHNELEVRVTERTLELIKLYEELESEKHRLNLINRLLKLFVENTSRKEFLDDAVKIIQEWCKCRCLGIRILDEKGNIPYEAHTGFSQEFLESESLLSVNSDQCACIRVIMKRPGHEDLSAMTEYGSFYSNNTFKFVDGLTDTEKSRFRGVCVRSGFKSLAIIPIFYHAKVLGAIHLADEKEGVVQINKVKFIETLSPVIGEAIYRFNAEEELRRSREELRSLAAHLQAVREEERTTIAREIHDELGQIMTALKFDLSWIRNNYGDHENLNKKTGSMIALMDETIQTVRRIITELRPGILDHLGISAAMEWQAEEFQKHAGIPCNIVITPEEIILNKDLSINIFRIFQEILTNIMRHSEATSVNVLLKKTDGKIFLRVEDNGKGITEEEILKPASFGIMGMSERVHYMSGSLKIDGIPQEGTTIEVVVPIDGKPQH